MTPEETEFLTKLAPSFPMYIPLTNKTPVRKLPIAGGRAALAYAEDATLAGILVGLLPHKTPPKPEVFRHAREPTETT